MASLVVRAWNENTVPFDALLAGGCGPEIARIRALASLGAEFRSERERASIEQEEELQASTTTRGQRAGEPRAGAHLRLTSVCQLGARPRRPAQLRESKKAPQSPARRTAAPRSALAWRTPREAGQAPPQGRPLSGNTVGIPRGERPPGKDASANAARPQRAGARRWRLTRARPWKRNRLGPSGRGRGRPRGPPMGTAKPGSNLPAPIGAPKVTASNFPPHPQSGPGHLEHGPWAPSRGPTNILPGRARTNLKSTGPPLTPRPLGPEEERARKGRQGGTVGLEAAGVCM